MNPWFRLYAEVLNDPKVQKLPPHLFKFWINSLCIACRYDGVLPSIDDMAYMLRRREDGVRRDITALSRRRLLDATDGTVAPHNWSGRQFRSDVSTQRVRAYRKRFEGVSRNVPGAVSETAPDSDSHSEKSRADHTRAREGFEQAVSDHGPVTELFDPRLGQFRTKIIDLYVDLKCEPCPDTGRADVWIAQGLDPAICLAVIRDILSRKRKPLPLAYFDNPIREAHERRTPARNNGSGAEPVDPHAAADAAERQAVMLRAWLALGDDQAKRLRAVKADPNRWPDPWGPPPGMPGCRIPEAMLIEHGIDPEKSAR